MDVRYYEEGRIFSAELVRDSDGPVFQLIADELTEVFNIQWKAKLDGFDQRYWDFEYKGITLSLYLEHFLGIIIFVKKPETNIKNAKKILEEIGEHFKTWNP
ncbi:MAG TPA: DUF3630 family protein [Anaerolineales bacterium]